MVVWTISDHFGPAHFPTLTSTKKFCDTIATSIARYEKYRCWASKARGTSHAWQLLVQDVSSGELELELLFSSGRERKSFLAQSALHLVEVLGGSTCCSEVADWDSTYAELKFF